MLKANVHIPKGAVNNAAATIMEFKLKNGRVNKVTIKIKDTGEVLNLCRSSVHHFYHKQAHIAFRSFPCILGYAMSAHASQGATITGKALLIVREAFTPGLLYVMLSRVTCRANLRLGTPLVPSHFTPLRLPPGAMPMEEGDLSITQPLIPPMTATLIVLT